MMMKIIYLVDLEDCCALLWLNGPR